MTGKAVRALDIEFNQQNSGEIHSSTRDTKMTYATLILEDGSRFQGHAFGKKISNSGEVGKSTQVFVIFFREYSHF